MYKTAAEAVELIKELKGINNNGDVDVVVCPPFTALKDVGQVLAGCDIKLGAQNVHWEDAGAFTGDISALMLKELRVGYVIVGHSERRKIFGETDALINKKVRKVLEKDMVPILCVGETLEEREADKTEEIVKQQTIKDLQGLNEEEIKKIVIAYEPIWAIGTGRTATSGEANRVIGYIRDIIKGLTNSQVAERIRILYGGSVKPDNASGLLVQPQIDGALVGGASLDAQKFSTIIKQAIRKEK